MEIALEPFDGTSQLVDLVLAFDEAVALLGVVDRINRAAFLFEDGDDLLCLFERDANVALALENEQRGALVANVLQRRGRFVDGAVLLGIAEEALLILLQACVFVLQHGVPVQDSVLVDCSGPDVRRFADGHQGHEAAVGAAPDADLLRVDEAGRFEEVDACNLVLQVRAAEVFVVGLLELHAVAGRSAHVGRDDDEAARGEEHGAAVEVVQRLAGGPAVRHDDGRCSSVALKVERYPDEGRDEAAIEALIGDELRSGQSGRRKCRALVAGDLFQLATWMQQIEICRMRGVLMAKEITAV